MTAFSLHSDEVLEAIRAGASVADAAREAGLSPRTVQRWLARGRREQAGAHRDFTEAVEAAWRARELPPSDEPMGDGELRVAVSEAARAGSIPAMRLCWEMLRADRERRAPNALDEFDELARRRARR